MFIGHFGVGFGAKQAEQEVSLGTFFLAVQFIDLLWPLLLLLGLEQAEIRPGITVVTPLDFVNYPISHSMLMVLVWGLLFGGVHWLFKKNKRAAIILGLCVVSHWLLDLLMHRPDLPLYPGSEIELGLGIWNSLTLTLVIEAAVFLLGLVLYLRSTKAKNKIGSYGLWSMIIFLVAVYLANIFGPAPPDMNTVAWAGNLQWIVILWAYWVDRNRSQDKH